VQGTRRARGSRAVTQGDQHVQGDETLRRDRRRVDLALGELLGDERRQREQPLHGRGDGVQPRAWRQPPERGGGQADGRGPGDGPADRVRPPGQRARDDGDLAPGPEIGRQGLGEDAARTHAHDRPEVVGPAQREQELAAGARVVGDELAHGEAFDGGSQAGAHGGDGGGDGLGVARDDGDAAHVGLVEDGGRHDLDHGAVAGELVHQGGGHLGLVAHRLPAGDCDAGGQGIGGQGIGGEGIGGQGGGKRLGHADRVHAQVGACTANAQGQGSAVSAGSAPRRRR